MLILTARQIPETDEAEPPVAGLTPVRDDNESNISILYLDEEIPRQSPVPVRRRLLYAFLVSQSSDSRSLSNSHGRFLGRVEFS